MGLRWTGGEVINGPGGGFKVNILKEALEDFKHMTNLIVLFLDGWVVIFENSILIQGAL